MALRYANGGRISENGRGVIEGNAKTLAGNENMKEFYLSIFHGDKKSFRAVKHYPRRKRWLG